MFRNRHFKENLICLAVDEAHLIEKWCVFVYVCVCVGIALILFICRGKKFRLDFAHIGEIRSLLPPRTNVTATANLATRKIVIQSLEMRVCYIKSQDPNKVNIQYAVLEKPNEIMTIIKPIVAEVCKKEF